MLYIIKNKDIINFLSNNNIPYKLLSNNILDTNYQLKYPQISYEIPKYIPKILLRDIYNEVDLKINNKILSKDTFVFALGPCSVESEEQIKNTISFMDENNLSFLRAGAFKPRTNPNSFQGLGQKGIEIVNKYKKDKVFISEIMDIRDLDYFINNVDIIQVGARNMYNYSLLKELGRTKKTILLKRSFSATIEELLNACLYIYNEGNKNIIICERGIRGFDSISRNLLDLNSIIILKKITNLKIFVDPSHAIGKSFFIPDIVRLLVHFNIDGILLEMHNNPTEALSDNDQQLIFDDVKQLLQSIKKETKKNII